MNRADIKMLIRQMKEVIYGYNPYIRLNEIFSGTMVDFYKPIFEYSVNETVFSESKMFKRLIVKSVCEIYGSEKGRMLEEFLNKHFIADTATHYCFPRTYDNHFGIDYDCSITWNSYLLSAAMSKYYGQKIHFGLYTTQIPFSTINSPSVIEIGKNRYESIVPKKNKSDFVCLSKVDDKKYDEGLKKLENMAVTSIEKEKLNDIRRLRISGNVFADETILIHKYLLDDFLNSEYTGIEQITLPLDIATEFLATQLKDKTSIYYRIFGDSNNLLLFVNMLAGIRSGWKVGESPFYFVNEKFRLEHRVFTNEDHDMDNLISLLINKKIFPTTILLVVILLLSGMVPLGGMLQSKYASDAKDKLCEYLNLIGCKDRSAALKLIPVNLSMHVCAYSVKPNMALYNFEDLKDMLKKENQILEKCLNVSMNESFYNALPTLYNFFVYYVSSREKADYRKLVINLDREEFLNVISK